MAKRGFYCYYYGCDEEVFNSYEIDGEIDIFAALEGVDDWLLARFQEGDIVLLYRGYDDDIEDVLEDNKDDEYYGIFKVNMFTDEIVEKTKIPIHNKPKSNNHKENVKNKKEII